MSGAESRKEPTYSLDSIKEHARAGRLRITRSARNTALELSFDATDIKDCILGLDDCDFFKTMPSEKIPDLMQDVYKTFYGERNVYIKVQISHDGNSWVISFKKDDQYE